MKSLATLPHPSDDPAWDARMKAAFNEMFVQITPPKAIEPWVVPISQEDSGE